MIQTHESVISFLKRDFLKNMNMIYFMEDNPVASLERIGDAVMMRGESDHPWVYISAAGRKDLDRIISRLNRNDRYFAVVEDWMIPSLMHCATLNWKLSAMKYILPVQKSLPAVSSRLVSPLTTEDADYIYAHSNYQAAVSPVYIRERIRKGPACGIRKDGKLLAWAMTHDDGAIGFLHVLESFRKQGLAMNLMLYLVAKVRSTGRMPFGQIEEENTPSIRLIRKLGFQGDRRVHWMELGYEQG